LCNSGENKIKRKRYEASPHIACGHFYYPNYRRAERYRATKHAKYSFAPYRTGLSWALNGGFAAAENLISELSFLLD